MCLRPRFVLSLFLFSGLLSCTQNYYTKEAVKDDGTSEYVPLKPCDKPVDPASFTLDLFGVAGHTMVMNITREQADKMDAASMVAPMGGGGGGGGLGDLYFLGDANATFADELFVIDQATDTCTNLGKVEVWEKGSSTLRPWTQIPSLRVDTDQFQEQVKLGGFEHVALHNGQVGSIFREAIALRVWDAMGYPVPETNFVWLQTSIWGDKVKVPYTLVEVYKAAWCKNHKDEIAGGCRGLWEGFGDFFSMECRLTAGCQNDGKTTLAKLVMETVPGPGFFESLKDLLDWSRFMEFQCLSWLTATGDDYIHSGNNMVALQRNDGKFMFLPFSTDISAGQDWYAVVELPGMTPIASGCQQDPKCWAQLLNTCEGMITDFETLNPAATIVEDVYQTLVDHDMLRSGDEGRYENIRTWYAERAENARKALITYRDPCFQMYTWDGMVMYPNGTGEGCDQPPVDPGEPKPG